MFFSDCGIVHAFLIPTLHSRQFEGLYCFTTRRTSVRLQLRQAQWNRNACQCTAEARTITSYLFTSNPRLIHAYIIIIFLASILSNYQKHLQCNPKNATPNAALKSNQSTTESVNHTTYSINNRPISEEVEEIKGPQAEQVAVSALS
jgi:hypothetical protein